MLKEKIRRKKDVKAPVADVIASCAAKAETKWEPKKTHYHYSRELVFPNGVKVQASSLDNYPRLTKPKWGLYASKYWEPLWRAEFITWDDFGLPSAYDMAFEAIEYAYGLCEQGVVVEVGCHGGHGRTGTILACMGVLAGLDHKDAIAYVRRTFCDEAIETAEQEWFVEWFECHLTDSTPSKKPNNWVYEYLKEKDEKELDTKEVEVVTS